MRLFRFAGELSDLQTAFNELVNSIEELSTNYVELLQSLAIQFGDPSLSVPSDAAYNSLGITTDLLSTAEAMAYHGETTDVLRVLSAIGNRYNTMPIVSALSKIGQRPSSLQQFSAGDISGYVLYINAVKERVDELSGECRLVIDAQDEKIRREVFQILSSSGVYGSGAQKEVPLSGIISDNNDVDNPEIEDTNAAQRVDDALSVEFQYGTIVARDEMVHLKNFTDKAEKFVGKLSDKERALFSESLISLAESLRMGVEAIKASVFDNKNNPKEIKDKFSKLAITVAVNELMQLADSGVIDKGKLDILSAFQMGPNSRYGDIKSAYDILSSNFGYLAKDDRSSFGNILEILKKLSLNETMTQSDVAELQRGAEAKVENDLMESQGSGTIPLSDPKRINEMKGLIRRESNRIAEFMLWKMASNIPSALVTADKSFGLMAGTPKSVMSIVHPDSSVVFDSGNRKIFMGANRYNFHKEYERRAGDFRNRIMSRLLYWVDKYRQGDMGVELPSSSNRRIPGVCALGVDVTSDTPTSIDYERVVMLGGELYGACRGVPMWTEGGERTDKDVSDIVEKMDEIFSAYVYHSKTGVYESDIDASGNVGTSSGVSTPYDIVVSYLAERLRGAADKGDTELFEQLKESLAGVVNISCPWMADIWRDDVTEESVKSDVASVSNALSQQYASPTPVAPYSLRTSESSVLLSKSLVFLIKSYCNMAGFYGVEKNAEGFIESLTIDGHNIIRLLITNTVEELEKLSQNYVDDNFLPERIKVSGAKDTATLLFGSDQETLYDASMKIISYNIEMLFPTVVQGGGRKSHSASNTRQFSDLIGVLSSGLSEYTNMLGTEAFDVSASLSLSAGDSRHIIGALGTHARRGMRSIGNLIDTGGFKSDISETIQSSNDVAVIRVPLGTVPNIPPGSYISIIDGSGSEIASSTIDSAPTMKYNNDSIEMTIHPGFGELDLSGVGALQMKVDMYGISPDSNAYAAKKIYTGRHLVYAEEMLSKFDMFKATIVDLMSQGKSGVIDAESVILALDGLKKLRKSIWNTVAILPSLEDLSRYDESFGYTGHPLDADTGKLSRELMNMAKSISAFINMNKKYVA